NASVSAFTRLTGGGGDGVEVENVPVQAIGVQPVVGHVLPEITQGRAPARADEVALGGKLLRRLHVAVGDEVAVAGSSGQGKAGGGGRAVVAPGIANDQIDLGDGAVMTTDGLQALEDAPVVQYLVTFHDGGAGAGLAQLRRDFPNTVLTSTNSAEVANLARV